MSKFNVGDMVRVRDWEDMVEEYGTDSYGEDIMIPTCSFISSMKEYCGGVFEVTEVGCCGENTYHLSSCSDWFFTNDMLRLVRRAEETVKPIQASVLFAFSNAGVEVEEEYAITTVETCEYDYTDEEMKGMIQALADYLEVEIDFPTRNCSVGYEMVDVPLETIDEEENAPYNGKVVCIREDEGLTIGKIYNIVDGFFIDDDEEKRPMSKTGIYKDDFWFTEGLFIPLTEG